MFIFALFLASVFSHAAHAAADGGFEKINGGTFLMGSPADEPERSGNEAQRRITLNSFYIGKYEVTQTEYEELMRTNPSRFNGDDLPVERVSWFDAVEYCNERSEAEGLTPAYTIDKNKIDTNNRNPGGIRWVITWNRSADGYRLPTEAEWEYACRAGTTTAFNTGDIITAREANYDRTRPYADAARDTYRQKTTPVGSFPPNAFGLYDMHGNVGEWCWDWNNAFFTGTRTNPEGASFGVYRVFRGGSWNNSARFTRSACRSGYMPDGRGYYLGFRLVRNAE